MTTELSPFALSLQRAMPVTRLLDCGMDYADATALHARTSAGEPWDVAAEALADAQLARAAQAAAKRLTSICVVAEDVVAAIPEAIASLS